MKYQHLAAAAGIWVVFVVADPQTCAILHPRILLGHLVVLGMSHDFRLTQLLELPGQLGYQLQSDSIADGLYADQFRRPLVIYSYAQKLLSSTFPTKTFEFPRGGLDPTLACNHHLRNTRRSCPSSED